MNATLPQPSAPLERPSRRSQLLWLGLFALHVALFCGVFQCGFSRDEVHALLPPGPYKLIAPYVAALQREGPLGIVRVYYFGESDDRLYLEYARLTLHGEVDLAKIESVQKHGSRPEPLPARPWPYRDVTVEYPPLALLAMLPPALFSTSYDGYRVAFAAFMLLLHFANLALAFVLLRPTLPVPRGRLQPVTWLLCASLLWSVLLGRIAAARMDHSVVSWALLTLWAGTRATSASGAARIRWAAVSGSLAALGVMTKLVPGLALLALLIVWLCSNIADRIRLALVACIAGGLVLTVLNAGMFVFAGDRYLDTFRYHTLRGIQIESLYAGIMLGLHALGLPVHVSEAFGSTNLDSALTRAIQIASPWLFVVAAIVISARRWAVESGALVCLTLALLLAFVLTGRVFSPQYLIWIAAPLLAAAALDRPRGPFRVIAALYLALCLISQLIYPQGYPVLKAFHPLAVALLNLRNLGIVLLCVLIVRAASSPRRAH